jgi:hypothetical protein
VAAPEPTAALAAGNLTAAKQAAFEVPFVPLADARALVELYGEKGDRKYESAALKYLRRYMDEAYPSLTDVAQVAAVLAERGNARARAIRADDGPIFTDRAARQA